MDDDFDSMQFGIEPIDLSKVEVDWEAIAVVPPEVALKYNVCRSSIRRGFFVWRLAGWTWTWTWWTRFSTSCPSMPSDFVSDNPNSLECCFAGIIATERIRTNACTSNSDP